jgi:lysophospholipase L1-like esterase
MAYDGDRICDALHRFASEGCSREIDILLIAIGGNDLARGPDPDSPMYLSSAASFEYWNRLLILVKKHVEKIIVFDVLPMLMDENHHKGWFDAPMYSYNSDRIAYNDQVAKICESYGIPFIRRYDKWKKLDLSEHYVDSSHPNAKGHQLIADQIFEELEKIGIV